MRLRKATVALERLTEPAVLDALVGLAEEAPALRAQVAALPDTTAMVMDMADQLVDDLRARGVDLPERAMAALPLLEKLSDPAMMATLERLLGQLPAVEAQLRVLPDTLGMMMDVADGLLRDLERQGVELDTLVVRGVDLLQGIGRLATSPELKALLDSKVLDAGAVAVVGQAGEALAHTRSASPGHVGLFGALGALSEPSVQRSLHFALTFARHFGTALEAQRALPSSR